MRLRNKKTGEIVDFMIHKYAELSDDGNPVYIPFNDSIKEWEDYEEEPKDFWHIDDFMIMCGTEGEFTTPDLGSFTKKDIEKLKAIGNYFETKEEAEKAVEKLKAWKRLKDKEFRFYNYTALGCGEIHFMLDWEDIDVKQLIQDLDLLFSREDD